MCVTHAHETSIDALQQRFDFGCTLGEVANKRMHPVLTHDRVRQPRNQHMVASSCQQEPVMLFVGRAIEHGTAMQAGSEPEAPSRYQQVQ